MLVRVLNHMACPALRYDELMRLGQRLGCQAVHLRTDLGRPLFDGDSPARVKALSEELGIRISGLAQLERFNDWSTERAEQAHTLSKIAQMIGAVGIGLIPVNDGTGTDEGVRHKNLIHSLKQLKPILEVAGLKGFIEPLGFAESSLRHKSEAVDAIEAADARGLFELVHDSFHHYLANGAATGASVFPEYTGMAEVSGVVDQTLKPMQMTDTDRVLVDEQDCTGAVDQLRELFEAGFSGPVAFEPFAPEVHAMTDPESQLGQSFEFIEKKLGAFCAG